MSFIGDIIGGVIGALTSGLIAIYISYKSIKKEHKERYNEKLQDRKDMWLDEHYKYLSNEFENLASFNTSIQNMNRPTLKGYTKILETNLVTYRFLNSYIKVLLEPKLDDLKTIYKNSISHLTYGYSKPDYYKQGHYIVCKKIDELWETECQYKNLLSDYLNEILEKSIQLMKANFPGIKPSTGFINKSFNAYNIKIMVNTLIQSRIKNVEELEFNQKDGTIHPRSNIGDIIAFLDKPQYNKFKNNVWIPLNNEFAEKIDKLIKVFNESKHLENKFTVSIKDKIDDYKSGHRIEGYCNICNKIKNETDIKKLRPKI